jgi:hypothetical protein
MPPPLKQRGAVLDHILQQMAVTAADTLSSDDLKAFTEGLVLQVNCSPLN